MKQRRKHKRVEVNLPIYCKFADLRKQTMLSSIGQVENISLGGMKIRLPVGFPAQSKVVDYLLDLPQPYHRIRGQGRIIWTYWDAQAQATNLGIEMSALDQAQQADLETILSELNPEKYFEQ